MHSKVDELAERARKIAAESGANVRDKLGALQDPEEWEELRKTAEALGGEAAAFVRKYPLQSLLGAAALGFLAGLSLGRKR